MTGRTAFNFDNKRYGMTLSEQTSDLFLGHDPPVENHCHTLINSQDCERWEKVERHALSTFHLYAWRKRDIVKGRRVILNISRGRMTPLKLKCHSEKQAPASHDPNTPTACFIYNCSKLFTSLFNVLNISLIYHLCSYLLH